MKVAPEETKEESDQSSDTSPLIDSASSTHENIPSEPAAKKEYTRSDIYILLLKLALFFILWGLFIEWQLGWAYFVCALIVLVCLNTSKNRRKSGPSAYSVFNPNCERLEVQFTAEQFERELRGGALLQ